MADSITTEAFLDFNVEAIAEAFDEGQLAAEEMAAIEIVNLARANFDRKTQDLGTGEMGAGFFDFKSFFVNGGWVAGVFDEDGPEWTETVGGRAAFFEYGRSAPGSGRKSTGSAQASKERAQPPRPFIRPARNAVSKKYGGITSQQLARVAARMNKYSSVSKAVNSAVNKIK